MEPCSARARRVGRGEGAKGFVVFSSAGRSGGAVCGKNVEVGGELHPAIEVLRWRQELR